jgi:hypothetical protein
MFTWVAFCLLSSLGFKLMNDRIRRRGTFESMIVTLLSLLIVAADIEW